MVSFQFDYVAKTVAGSNDSGTVPAHGTVALTSGGGEGAYASVIVASTGEQNDIRLIAKTTGSTYNGAGIMLIDDGTITGDDAQPYWDANADMLIVKIDSGATTAKTIISMVNERYESDDMWDPDTSTGFRADYRLEAVSTGTITVPVAVTDGGNDGTAASGSFTVRDDAITVTAANVGTDYNNVQVVLVAGDTEDAVYDSDNKIITVTIDKNGTTTTEDIATLIHGLDDFSASGGDGTAVFAPTFADVTGNTGVDGVTGVAASATFTVNEDTITVTAAVTGEEWSINKLVLTSGGSLGEPSFDAPPTRLHCKSMRQPRRPCRLRAPSMAWAISTLPRFRKTAPSLLQVLSMVRTWSPVSRRSRRLRPSVPSRFRAERRRSRLRRPTPVPHTMMWMWHLWRM